MSRLRQILRSLKAAGYRIFSRPYELNIVGVRSDSVRPNSFDDTLNVFFRDAQGDWIWASFPATTDPGTYWLENPMVSSGTAILKPGQYLGAYGIGKHQGKYYALCQLHGKVTVIRDYDRDRTLDFFNGREETGRFGINIHRASPGGTTALVERHSAGCQVFARSQDFEVFMRLCETHRRLYGNRFTYTLIDERMQKRRRRGNLIKGAGLATLALGGFGIWKWKNAA